MDTCSIAEIYFQCFQLDSSAPKFFGFSEFIAGLALLILAWTISDVRYKFRITTAIIPIKEISFFIIFSVGILALLTDFWRAQKGWVPAGSFLTPESWQFFLGALFLFTVLIWLWCAFIKPAKFSHLNSKRFVRAVKASIMRGSPSELAIIADELSRSAARIVRYASENADTINQADLLLITIGSNKFCRATVQEAPELIRNLFNEISYQKKYKICIEVFTKNIVTAAIENKNSFLYCETDYYESGLEGIAKPITSALCQDPEIIKNIDTLLSPNDSRHSPWDIEQWKAYFRLFLDAFSSYIKINDTKRPSSIHWAYSIVPSIINDLTPDLQLTKLGIHDDLYIRLKALTDLIKYMVTLLDEQATQETPLSNNAIEDVVKLIYTLIKNASSVRAPRNVARRIQYSIIWDDLMNSHELRTDTGLIIQNKIHHMLYRKILKCPNLDSIRILGYCLNVLGFYPPEEGEQYGRSWREFHISLLDWVKLNVAELLNRYPKMKYECFVEGMSYDAVNCKLVIEYPADKGSKTSYDYFSLSLPKNKPNTGWKHAFLTFCQILRRPKLSI